MRRTRMLTVVVAAACALAIGVPVASAGWEGQLDFDTIASDEPQLIDRGPAGPSAGDLMRLSQTVEIIGLTRADGPLQVGAIGTLSGTFVFLNQSRAQANLTLRLAAGLIRVSGWLTLGEGPPTNYVLFAHGWGGMLTGSRGQVVIYPDDGGGTQTSKSIIVGSPPPPGTDFSIILR